MYTDRTSLTELGLLPDAMGTWPLAALLDHTHAPASHEALKRLLAEPLDNLDDLRARQRLLPSLATLATQLPWHDLHVLAAQVDGYLSSNYVFVPEASVARAVFAARYRDIVTFVDARVRAVDALLTLCTPVAERVAALPADAAFARVVRGFRACADPRRERIRALVSRGNRGDIVSLDRLLRRTDQSVGVDEPYSDALRALVGAMAQLDAFCSLATASAQIGGVVPQMMDRAGAELSLTGVRHPLLSGGVPNDLDLTPIDRVVMLTGPNMAGKSTLLRAVGLAVYAAHLGMAVAARAATMPLYDRLLVSMTARDNLQRGESLYLAEVRRVKAIVSAVDGGASVFAIFDEVFRGTNINDAMQATALLIDGLARAPFGTFIIASHLADVAQERVGCGGVSCWCMEVQVTGESVDFSYRAVRGVSDVHLGMRLLDAEGVGPVLRRLAARPLAAGC